MNNCIYCGRYVPQIYISMDGEIHKNIRLKQSGKYGQIIVAHMSCYLNNNKTRRNVK